MCDKKPFGRLAETSAVRHSLEGVPVDTVADVMGRLISQGLIRGWGMSQVSAETLAKAHKVTAVSAVQNLYSMLERDCEKRSSLTAWNTGSASYPFLPLPAAFSPGKSPRKQNLKATMCADGCRSCQKKTSWPISRFLTSCLTAPEKKEPQTRSFLSRGCSQESFSQNWRREKI